MNRHPLSAVFGDMPKSELQQLADDIRTHGLRDPVIVYQEQVLDGWHRYRACEIAGVLPTLKALPGGQDPVAFVASKNLHRRSLTASQRAAIVVMLHDWVENGSNQHAAEGRNPVPTLPVTEKQMAAEAAVSDRTIRQAKAAVQNGRADDVVQGKVSVKEAAKKPDAPQKPKPASPLEKARAAIDALQHELNDLRAKHDETVLLLESAWDAQASEEDQRKKWEEMHRKNQTLESRLDEEINKSASFVKENRWLRAELKKLGWQE